MMRLGDLLKLDAPDRDALIGAELTDDMKTQRITGICADSRKVQRGNLFVAISGVQTDGAAFIDSAVEAGAVAVLIDEKLDMDPSVLSVPLIRSNNPRRALALLAARFFPRQPKIIIGVTGTADVQKRRAARCQYRHLGRHCGWPGQLWRTDNAGSGFSP